MAVQAIPTPTLVVIKPAFALGILVELLDHPALMGEGGSAATVTRMCATGQLEDVPGG